MLDICNNNIITMTRGDDVTIPLHLFYNVNDKLTNIAFFINKYDKVLFGVCEPNQRFEEAIIKKVIPYDAIVSADGTVPITLTSTDTEFLHLGNYYYTVKILRKPAWKEIPDEEGTLETVVSKTKFILID